MFKLRQVFSVLLLACVTVAMLGADNGASAASISIITPLPAQLFAHTSDVGVTGGFTGPPTGGQTVTVTVEKGGTIYQSVNCVTDQGSGNWRCTLAAPSGGWPPASGNNYTLKALCNGVSTTQDIRFSD